ncbi:MAG: hypothetical protein ACOZNI_30045 [Myxococcota bacterium]
MNGQIGIRVREALAAGDWRAAADALPELDEAHHVEILLGAALRDAREGHLRARLYLSTTDWAAYCRQLVTEEPDRSLDDLAAAYVAERRVPDTWRPGGEPLRERVADDLDAARLYAAGVAGDALIDAFGHKPLHPAVAHYYRRGRIWGLGPRPMLVLAAS